MRITVVRDRDYKLNDSPSAVILEKESGHVPNQGDVIKVGHNLNGFEAFTVQRRVFRSLPGKMHDNEAFQEVIVVVDDDPVG
jgi:hypothetical protein